MWRFGPSRMPKLIVNWKFIKNLISVRELLKQIQTGACLCTSVDTSIISASLTYVIPPGLYGIYNNYRVIYIAPLRDHLMRRPTVWPFAAPFGHMSYISFHCVYLFVHFEYFLKRFFFLFLCTLSQHLRRSSLVSYCK